MLLGGPGRMRRLLCAGAAELLEGGVGRQREGLLEARCWGEAKLLAGLVERPLEGEAGEARK